LQLCFLRLFHFAAAFKSHKFVSPIYAEFKENKKQKH
jgi:hypothetical protein